MLENIKEKALEIVGNIDTEEIKGDLKYKAENAAEFVKGLDVGNLVSEGRQLAEKIDKDFIKNKINDFRDNAKYDGTRSMLRSVGDFLGNYPRYYIEGLAGTIQDLFEKK